MNLSWANMHAPLLLKQAAQFALAGQDDINCPSWLHEKHLPYLLKAEGKWGVIYCTSSAGMAGTGGVCVMWAARSADTAEISFNSFLIACSFSWNMNPKLSILGAEYSFCKLSILHAAVITLPRLLCPSFCASNKSLGSRAQMNASTAWHAAVVGWPGYAFLASFFSLSS